MLANHNFGDFYANYITRCTSEAEIEDITCPGVRYRVEHEEIKFISTGAHVIFCLLHKHQSKRRDLLCNHNDGDLFTCKDNMLFSRVKI